MYIFDTTPMYIAILLFNIVHPGKYMPGKESDLPSRKEVRLEKRERKAAKKAAKQNRLRNGSQESPEKASEIKNQENVYGTATV